MTQHEDRLYEQLVQAGMETNGPSEELRRRVLAIATAVSEEQLPCDDSTVSPDSKQPAIRLVPDVPTALADGVERATHRIEQPPSRRHVSGRFRVMVHSRRMRWSIAAGVAAGVVLAVGLWPGKGGRGSGGGALWAQVVEQIRSARTVHTRLVIQDPAQAGGQEVVRELYMKAPDKARLEGVEPTTQREMVYIVDGKNLAVLYPAEKQYERSLNTVMPVSTIGDTLSLLYVPPIVSGQGQTGPVPDESGQNGRQLVLCGRQERDGRQLDKYVLEDGTSRRSDGAAQETKTYVWLKPANNEVVLVTMDRTIDGVAREVGRAMVEMNADLPDDLFVTTMPEGYREGSATASGLGDVYSAYEQARNETGSYRLIAWKQAEGKRAGFRPAIRSARDGEKWRVDEVGWPTIGMETPFEAVWSQLGPAPQGISVYHNAGRTVRILWRDGKVGQSQDGDDPNLRTYLLAQLGRPGWPENPLNSVAYEGGTYRRLPDRADHPGLIGIEYTGKPDHRGGSRLEVFWIDPAKDYLCVYHENHGRSASADQVHPSERDAKPLPADQAQATWTSPENYTANENYSTEEIIEFAQSPDGRWYPSAIRTGCGVIQNGTRYDYGLNVTRIQVDFAGPIPVDLFELPADLPGPQ